MYVTVPGLQRIIPLDYMLRCARDTRDQVPLLSHVNWANPRIADRHLEDRMADHGPVEHATAQGDDLPAHEAMYERFVHLVLVGGAHVVNIILGLAIGAVTEHWRVAFGIFVIATIVAVHGFMTGTRTPSVVMVGISMLALALTAGAGRAS